jgi:tetratricopeptide (TPR) repeat protein
VRIWPYIFVFYFLTCIQLKAQQTDSLIAKLATAKEDTNKVKLLNSLAGIFIGKDLLKAKEYSSQSIKLAEKLNFIKGKASAIGIAGVIFREQGNVDSAEYLFKISETLFEGINDLSGQTTIMAERSSIYVTKGLYDKALDIHQKSLKIYIKLNDKENEARILFKIGRVYSLLSQYKLSENNFLKALKIKQELGDERGMAYAYTNLGGNSYNANEYEKAIEYINKALNILEKLGDRRLILANRTNRGNVYVSLKKYDLALKDHEFCLEQNTESKDTLAMINSLTSLGDVCNYTGKFKLAIDYFLKAQLCLKDTTNLVARRTIYFGLGDAFSGAGDNKNASEYYKKAYLLDNRIFTSDLSDKIAELKETFEAEKRAKEIDILKEKENNLRLLAEKRKLNVYIAVIGIILVLIILFLVIIIGKHKRDKLKLETAKNKAIFEQKALRAQMNPHFIFNSLNSIQKYILQDQSQEAYDYLAKFSKLIRQVLMNSERSDITIKDEVELLKLYVELEQRRFKNRFDYSINCSDKVPLDFKLPIMLVQPFVENAIWHGLMNLDKTKHGLLAIDFELEQDNLKIQIRDNGIGREAAALKRKDSEYKSVGMMFTQKRLELLKESGNVNAKVEITDLKDEDGRANGTLVEIKLPLIIFNGD